MLKQSNKQILMIRAWKMMSDFIFFGIVERDIIIVLVGEVNKYCMVKEMHKILICLLLNINKLEYLQPWKKADGETWRRR
jgi:hypothetical protein